MTRPGIATTLVVMQYAIAAGLIVSAISDASTLAVPALVAVVVALALRQRTAWSWRVAVIADLAGFVGLGFTMVVNRESNSFEGTAVWLMAIAAGLLFIPDARNYFDRSRLAPRPSGHTNERS